MSIRRLPTRHVNIFILTLPLVSRKRSQRFGGLFGEVGERAVVFGMGIGDAVGYGSRNRSVVSLVHVLGWQDRELDLLV
ncbi:hypothetical protein KCU62_g90, partial [Aureobasidium sp. EXF-3399]